MIFLVICGAASYGGLVLRGGIKARWFWLACAVLQTAAVLLTNRVAYPIFCSMFIAPMLVAGIATHKTILRSQTFFLWAASDVLFVLSLSARLGSAGGWDVPRPGLWPLPVLLAAAAGLRFAAGFLETAPAALGLASIAWWQGALFVVLIGPRRGLELVGLAAFLLLFAVIFQRTDRSAVLLWGGALAALLATGSASVPLVAAAGLATFAFLIGERAITPWVLLGAPLALSGASKQLGQGATAPMAVLVPILMVSALWLSIKAAPTSSTGGRALAVGALLLTATGFGSLVTALWFWGGVALAATITVGLAARTTFLEPPPQQTREKPVNLSWALMGWGATFIAAALTLRLLLIGVSTGFV